jgi:hypothetical protein
MSRFRELLSIPVISRACLRRRARPLSGKHLISGCGARRKWRGLQGSDPHLSPLSQRPSEPSPGFVEAVGATKLRQARLIGGRK